MIIACNKKGYCSLVFLEKGELYGEIYSYVEPPRPRKRNAIRGPEGLLGYTEDWLDNPTATRLVGFRELKDKLPALPYQRDGKDVTILNGTEKSSIDVYAMVDTYLLSLGIGEGCRAMNRNDFSTFTAWLERALKGTG